MLKRIQTLWPWPLPFAAGLIALAVWTTLPLGNEGIQIQGQQREGHEQQSAGPVKLPVASSERRTDYSGDAIAVFTAMLVGATTLLWVATGKLSDSTEDLALAAKEQVGEMKLGRDLAEKQLDLAERQYGLAQLQGRVAEKTLEISVRPVVRPSGVSLREVKPRAIVFELVNHGSGPATLKGLQVHGTIGLDERVIFSFGKMSAFQSGDEGVTIEAGGEPLGPVEVLSERFSDATIHSLMVSSELGLSIRIIVTAEDILGNSIRRVAMLNWDHMRRGFIPHTGLPKHGQ
ncbi:MAG TPA: hypothetical protein VGF71_15610 [Caulobacteraceae bacterium]|jgi:hypothetical protein